MLDMGYAAEAARSALQRCNSVDEAIDLIASEDVEAPGRPRSRSPRRPAPKAATPAPPRPRPRKEMEALAEKAVKQSWWPKMAKMCYNTNSNIIWHMSLP